jgi:hypothetical protein
MNVSQVRENSRYCPLFYDSCIFVDDFTMLSVFGLYSVEWWNDCCVEKDLEGSGICLED